MDDMTPTELFIDKARIVHGDLYDYSEDVTEFLESREIYKLYGAGTKTWETILK